jgi:histidyl-tRNA synthetase
VVLGFGALDFDTLRARYGDAPAVRPHIERFAEYLAHCEALGVGAFIKFDLTIVRGLAYYTGIVFELFDHVGEFRAICGGGRYDNLLKSLGGTDLPALGFGMGDVVIGELLRARGLMPASAPSLQYWVAQAPDASGAPRAALETAAAMRHAGCVVEFALRAQKLDKQIEAGRKAGAATFIVVDPANADAPWRVRRAGHDDQTFSTLEALCAWASQQNGTVR